MHVTPFNGITQVYVRFPYSYLSVSSLAADRSSASAESFLSLFQCSKFSFTSNDLVEEESFYSRIGYRVGEWNIEYLKKNDDEDQAKVLFLNEFYNKSFVASMMKCL